MVPAAAMAAAVAAVDGAQTGPVKFDKVVLNDKYYCDGGAFGDINKDGKLDIVAGPYWYEGPAFTTKHAFYPVGTFWDAKGVPQGEPTNSMFSWLYDFNGDGWLDVMIMGRPLVGSPYWYENNHNQPGDWIEHKIGDHLFGESPQLIDIDGDGKPEAMTNSGGKVGFLAPDWSNPGKPWIFSSISASGDWYEYTHGLGVGDVDGDGRLDLVLPDHWFKQPAKGSTSPIWPSFITEFRETQGHGDGGAQMYVYDVDGDGDNDVVTSLHAHKWGLAWYENTKVAGQIKWVEHKLMGDPTEIAKYGVAFSQPHAMEFADLDGDGLKDIIVGKRRWAHGPTGDVDPGGTPVLYWWKLVRDPVKGATFIPYLIDDNSGVGTQLAAGDVNGDGTVDILSASKLGTFLFLNRSPSRVFIAPKDLAPGDIAARFKSLSGFDAAGRSLPILRSGAGVYLMRDRLQPQR
jgi:hypothetical protein